MTSPARQLIIAKPNAVSDRLRELEQLIVILRGPGGCPWDREQRLSDLRAYILEEAHEVAAAIDSGINRELASELGDLLFQIVFVAKLAEAAGAFDLTQVIRQIQQKMIRRHPHVFGEECLADSAAVREAWERRKLANREQSILAGVPTSLPTLLAAYRMTQKAAAVGFDWPDLESIVAKVEEELAELQAEIAGSGSGHEKKSIREEIGDLIFTVANLARRLEVDPEAALASANEKFKRRFQSLEIRLSERGGSLADATLGELDELWNEVKTDEG
jgi:MazG family protein